MDSGQGHLSSSFSRLLHHHPEVSDWQRVELDGAGKVVQIHEHTEDQTKVAEGLAHFPTGKAFQSSPSLNPQFSRSSSLWKKKKLIFVFLIIPLFYLSEAKKTAHITDPKLTI